MVCAIAPLSNPPYLRTGTMLKGCRPCEPLLEAQNLMEAIGYLLIAVARILGLVLNLYMWIIIARAILSWVSPDPYNPIVRFVYTVTEPVLGRLRSRLPLFFGGIDFTPMIVILLIALLSSWLVPYLDFMGRSLLRPQL
jgi:YggT family protein